MAIVCYGVSCAFYAQLSEGRALYNLGNVYHAKGKHIGRVGQQDPGEFSDEVKDCLKEAVKYYEYEFCCR